MPNTSTFVREPADIDAGPGGLSERQSDLQDEADAVAADLNLTELLSEVGVPVRVGSSALGLMVWRDLDVTVVCEELDIESVVRTATKLAQHPRVWNVDFRNDTGRWNVDEDLPDGFYVGLGYAAREGAEWRVDVWFVSEPSRQRDLEHVKALPDRLTEETRRSILEIKSVWHERPEYRRNVSSYDIYIAVLDDGVRTAEDFESWLARRQT